MRDFSELNIQELNELDLEKLSFEELDELYDKLLERRNIIQNELSQLSDGDRNSLSERMSRGKELSNIGRLAIKIAKEEYRRFRNKADRKLTILLDYPEKYSKEIEALCEEIDGYTEKIGDDYVNAYAKREMEKEPVDEASKVENKETGSGEVGDEEAGDEER